jgi:uncharacterized membrane protein YadS
MWPDLGLVRGTLVSPITTVWEFRSQVVLLSHGTQIILTLLFFGGILFHDSVDQTGNVIVSAAIISEEATEVAGIVKMVLNAALGIMASVIACYWNSRLSDDDDQAKEFRWIMLWDKFPKFTLGFIITSSILTGIMQGIGGTLEEVALPSAIASMNRWWFAIAFVGIGITTNIKTVFQTAWKSGVIQVYLLANTVDVLLALGLSYLAYGQVFE